MSHRSTLTLATWLTIASWGLAPQTAQAGPLLDWLFGRNRSAPAYPVGPAVPVANGAAAGLGGYAGNYGTYYSSQLPAIGPAGAGYTAPMPTGIAAATQPATLPPTLSYVPNFQTQAQRAPVTYYRPLLTTDPNTGAQVVAMAPCTSYEYMAQRVPIFGRSALFGSASPPVFQTPTQALPTYTLPSGGVPLAYTAPAITAPYSTAYGAYGTTPSMGGYPTGSATLGMAPTSVGPAGSYPTAPLGQSSYYGAQNGGSCGGFNAGSVPPSLPPGLVAPQAPATAIPSYPSSNYPQSTAPPTTYSPVPGYGAPGTSGPSSIYPPAGSDPGNTPPQLPPDPLPGTINSGMPPPGTSAQSNLRPQLRNITRQPRAGETPTVSSPAGQHADGAARDLPSMLPIPAPEDFKHEPRWNPPLLRDGDMTALRAVQPEAAQLAGQSKPIHWASFEQPSRSSSAAVEATVAQSPIVSSPSTSSGRLRPIQSPSQQAVPNHQTAVSPAVSPAALPAARDTGGWKVSRP